MFIRRGERKKPRFVLCFLLIVAFLQRNVGQVGLSNCNFSIAHVWLFVLRTFWEKTVNWEIKRLLLLWILYQAQVPRFIKHAFLLYWVVIMYENLDWRIELFEKVEPWLDLNLLLDFNIFLFQLSLVNKKRIDSLRFFQRNLNLRLQINKCR